MGRVTGIGGFFFRARDPEALGAWYEQALGIPSTSTSCSWEQEAGPTVFAPFPHDTDYIGRHEQQVMLNYRVDDLDAVLARLRDAGADVEDEIAEESFGRFAHASDPEGNRFELWQPADATESPET